MNVAIVGGRDFDDYEQFKSCISGENIHFKSIVSGGAKALTHVQRDMPKK